MSIQDVQTALALIADHGGGNFAGPRDEVLIARAEAALGLRFPPSYRAFLAALGCGDIEGFEVYGVIDSNFDASAVPNGIWLTLEERETGLPNHLVIVSDTGDGAYYALDTSRTDAAGECPVVCEEIDGRVDTVAEDFGTFLLEKVKAALEPD